MYICKYIYSCSCMRKKMRLMSKETEDNYIDGANKATTGRYSWQSFLFPSS